MNTPGLYDPFGAEIVAERLYIETFQERICIMRKDFDRLEGKYRAMCPELIHRYNNAFKEKEQRAPTQEEKKKQRTNKKEVKEAYRRLCNLTHPDKLRNVPTKPKKVLGEYFLQGKDYYIMEDVHGLTAVLVLASLVWEKIRSSNYDDVDIPVQKEGVDPYKEAMLKLASLRDTSKKLATEIQDLMESVFAVIRMFDSMGDTTKALDIFRALMGLNIRALDESNQDAKPTM